MTPGSQPSMIERLWGRPIVRRVAATSPGRWVADRRAIRRALDAFHARRGDRHPSRSEPLTPLPRTETLVPARPHTAARPDGTVPVTRYIILAEGRSGSTLLAVELGRRWPVVRSRLEEFSKDQAGWVSFEDAMRRTYLEVSGRTIVGCKVLMGQLTLDQLRELLELDDMRVILLRRRDLLRRYVSEKIARANDQWRLTAEGDRPPLEDRALTVRISEFHHRLRLSMRHLEDMDEISRDLPRLEVWFEDLEADLDGQLRRVAAFLGAGEPVHEKPPSLVRQNPEPLALLVENLDEVHEFLHSVGRPDLVIDEPDPSGRG